MPQSRSGLLLPVEMAEIKGVGTDKRMCQRLLFFMIDFFNAEAFYLKCADVFKKCAYLCSAQLKPKI